MAECCFFCINLLIFPAVNAIACVKGAVGGVIAGPIMAVWNLLVALVLLPQDVWKAYVAVTYTGLLGRNLKTLAFLILPVPLLLWPVVSLLYGLVAGFYIGGVLATAHIKGGKHCCELEDAAWLCHTLPRIFVMGYPEAVKETFKLMKGFAEWNSEAAFVYLVELKKHPGPAVDISFVRLLCSLPVALEGGLIGLVGCICQLPKAPFGLFKLWYETAKAIIKGLSKEGCGHAVVLIVTCFPFAILAFVAEPVGIALLCVLGPITGLVVGFMWAAVIGYKTPNMCDAFYYGLAKCWNGVCELDGEINKMLGCGGFPTCFFKIPETRGQLLQQPLYDPEAPPPPAATHTTSVKTVPDEDVPSEVHVPSDAPISSSTATGEAVCCDVATLTASRKDAAGSVGEDLPVAQPVGNLGMPQAALLQQVPTDQVIEPHAAAEAVAAGAAGAEEHGARAVQAPKQVVADESTTWREGTSAGTGTQQLSDGAVADLGLQAAKGHAQVGNNELS